MSYNSLSRWSVKECKEMLLGATWSKMSDNIIFKWPIIDHNMFRCISIKIGYESYDLNDFDIEEAMIDGDYLVLELIPPDGCPDTENVFVDFDRSKEKKSTLRDDYNEWQEDRKRAFGGT